MLYLTTPLPSTGLTPVETYIDKQKLWAAAQSDWDTAKITAQSMPTYIKACDLFHQE
jgi:hypothetical protein